MNFNNNYSILNIIDKGGFSIVYKAYNKEINNYNAIKIITKKNLQNNIKEKIQLEIKIHLKLNYKHIIKLYTSFEDENNYYLILELCLNMNLYKYLKSYGKLNEFYTSLYCKQIIFTLKYLQNYNIIHRDLKLSNILLDNNFNIKICDLGLVTQLEHPDEEHHTICGTPNYMAPEIISQKSHGFPADIWSLGCLCYAMLTGGKLPFEHKGDVREIFKKSLIGEYTFPPEIQISDNAKSFLHDTLQVVSFSKLFCYFIILLIFNLIFFC